MTAKTVMKFDIIQVLIKILKNVRHIEELALKVEKSNCKSKSKVTKIKHMLFRDFAS